MYQGGIARGYFSEELVNSIHNKMVDDLSKMGAKIDAIYYCPHYPGANHPLYGIDCDCRKPKTGLIKKALADFDIDKSKMFVVGDNWWIWNWLTISRHIKSLSEQVMAKEKS